MSDTANDRLDSAVLDSGGTDADGDGYISATQGGDDCNDGDALVHPGASEICNLVDDNCDATADEGCPATLDHSPATDGIQWSCSAAGSFRAPALALFIGVALVLARRRGASHPPRRSDRAPNAHPLR